MEARISYTPHPNQLQVHKSKARFKIIAAGRRSGKTTLAIAELIKHAIARSERIGGHPPRSWFISTTYRQAEMIAWKTCLHYLPPELIKSKNLVKLSIELVNGHLIEFKGSEDPDRLRGVALCFAVLDEYGFMSPEVWTEVIRPMLVDTGGGALFIGTPSPDGSSHFREIYNLGLPGHDPAHESWKFYTRDNPAIPQSEIEEAKRTLPPDIYKREFEADFDITAGLIYDNFKNMTHVIPNYEPSPDDFIVGSIDPGLHNPTGALLVAWDKDGVGRIFKEYYEKELLASENAHNIYELAKPHKVSYWVIDRASVRRDQTNGMTVFNKYSELLRPLLSAPNDRYSVWAGIDEVKKLFHVSVTTETPKLLVSAPCRWFLWEIGRYMRYKHKWHVERNEEEKPRKLDDHLMDCIRNMVYTKPWMRPGIRMYQPEGAFYR